MRAVRLDEPRLVERPVELGKAVLSSFLQMLARRDRWPGYGEPFNGQAIRAQTADFLFREFSPDTWIETGTWLGFTTRHLATYGVPVYSVELNPSHYHRAKRGLRRIENVTLICGDSADGLRRLAERPEIQRPMIYLDAHWGERLPLQEELDCAFHSWPDVILMIDDFLVPQDSGYRYDIYDGVALQLENLTIPDETSVAFPAAPAPDETGARSGVVYLGRGSGCEVIANADRQGLVVEGARADSLPVRAE